ncbi:MAG: ClbS/DfsB family four-helix bundle protein, partial [Planctomycetota bacterium]
DGGLRSMCNKLSEEIDRAGVERPGFEELECTPGWTVRELLSVRTWWTEATSVWIEAGLRGEVPETPAPGFTWQQTPQLNGEIVRLLADVPLAELRERLEHGVERVLKLAASLEDHQLLDAGVFEWAGQWPVARWVSVNTTRQYETARSFLRKTLRDST